MDGYVLSSLEEPSSQGIFCFWLVLVFIFFEHAWAEDVTLWRTEEPNRALQIRNQLMQNPWAERGHGSHSLWDVSIWHENQRWEYKLCFCWNSSEACSHLSLGLERERYILGWISLWWLSLLLSPTVPWLIFVGIWAPSGSPHES